MAKKQMYNHLHSLNTNQLCFINTKNKTYQILNFLDIFMSEYFSHIVASAVI